MGYLPVLLFVSYGHIYAFSAATKAMSNLKDHPYNVVPIVGEPMRYYVNSKSRPSMQHIVDLTYVEDGQAKSKAACGCEAFTCHPQRKGLICPHIQAVAKYLEKRMKRRARYW